MTPDTRGATAICPACEGRGYQPCRFTLEALRQIGTGRKKRHPLAPAASRCRSDLRQARRNIR